MMFVCAAQLRSLHPQQRVNHFPGMNFLTFKDQLVHTCRAVCQHICVVCLILYFGTFYFDFGDSNLVLLQV